MHTIVLHATRCCLFDTCSRIHHVKINGVIASEFYINALYASYLGVPVAFLSGDKNLTKQVIKENECVFNVKGTYYNRKGNNITRFNKNDIASLNENFVNLCNLINSDFVRIDHEEVIRILKEADVKWEFEPEYGEDIAREHEKYITEYFNGPVFIKNWPKDIKAFYMKQNADGKTVAAVDLEVPGAGELMGGSEREADYDKLVNRMSELGMSFEGLDWYVNLRKFGGCVHSGFGMGFERLLIYLTGVENIRDVIPFPRTPNNCDF